jgi:uncharacterized protein (TIGR00730 family)
MNDLGAREKQLNSPSYRVAALDQEFILSEAQRGVRFQLEYEKAEQVLRAWGVRSTIVVFGSARIHENGSSQQAKWYREARALGSIVSERDGSLHPVNGIRDDVIATGGGPGIMEAANRGASDVGAPSIGFNITLPNEQLPNPYTTPDLTFQFHYFAMRKMHFAMRANALVVFPGGFGTLDEMFEILALCQTRKMRTVPIILFDSEFWRRIINFDALVETGMIAAGDRALFEFAETAETAWTLLHKRLSPGTG